MKWGDVVLVDLNPVVGSEANKVRPAVIVSNNGANDAAAAQGRGVITVLPITSNATRVYPFQVLIDDKEDLALAGLAKQSKIQAEQIRSVDVSRIVRPIGRISLPLVRAQKAAMALHLGLHGARL
jgi:mRNA interferase MazF